MPEGGAVQPIVLDTHVWLWAVGGTAGALSEAAIESLEEAARSGGVLVPAICVWEVAMLESRGRLSLARPIDDWVHVALRAPGTSLLELSPEIAVESTRLPGQPHGDPADRLIIASARVAGGRLATRDRAILDYGAEGHVMVLDVTP